MILRDKPKLTYNGLTVVLSNPSRFDVKTGSLLTGNGGTFFNGKCLFPEYNRHQTDIRVKEDKSELLPNTKCLLLLGCPAMHSWLGNVNHTLNEVRGTPLDYKGIPTICSYLPQDSVDFKNHEKELNPLAAGFEDEDFEEDEDDDTDEKKHGKTSWQHYGFWLKKDVERCKYILKNGLPPRLNPQYIIYPREEEIISVLRNAKDQLLYFDCETDSNLNITCFSFAFNKDKIYVVPCLLPDYTWAYSNLPQIYRALAIGIANNTIVAHNGSNFDFFVLAHKYRIAIKKAIDTLLMMHRCYPEMEKSLGHGMSIWTWEQFHKDEGSGGYYNLEQAKKMWAYCGKDVFGMILIKEEIDKYALSRPGLTESIKQANESIRAYLTITLTGIRYDKELVDSITNENDRLMMQHIRMLEILIGKETLKTIRGKGQSSMPGSNPQCVRYFHDMLGYPVVSRGKERQDGTRGASLGKKNMFKLRLKQNNPVIDVCIAYRETGKETGALRFDPWMK